MDTKKMIRKEGNRIGLLVLINQLLFQGGTVVMLLVAAVGLNLLSVSKKASEGIALFLASDIMQLIAGVLFLGLYLSRKKTLQPMKKVRGTGFDIVVAFVIVMAANMTVSVVEILFRRGFGIQLLPADAALQVTADNFFAMLVLGAIFPAIVEELIYRGVLYRVLREHGVGYAMMVSSVIFGLIHMNFVQTPFAMVLGLVNCYLYEKTGRLSCSMLVHLMNNALTIALMRMPLTDTMNDLLQVALAAVFVLSLLMIWKKNINIAKKILLDVLNEKDQALYFFSSVAGVILFIVCIVASCFAIS